MKVLADDKYDNCSTLREDNMAVTNTHMYLFPILAPSSGL